MNVSALLLFSIHMHFINHTILTTRQSPQVDITIPFSLSEFISHTAEVKHAMPQESILGLLLLILSALWERQTHGYLNETHVHLSFSTLDGVNLVVHHFIMILPRHERGVNYKP